MRRYLPITLITFKNVWILGITDTANHAIISKQAVKILVVKGIHPYRKDVNVSLK